MGITPVFLSYDCIVLFWSLIARLCYHSQAPDRRFTQHWLARAIVIEIMYILQLDSARAHT